VLFWWIKWPLRILGLIVFGLVIYLVVSVVQVLTASRATQVPSAVSPAAAIVVMGESQSGKTLSADTTNRLEQALTLYEAKRAPVVIVAAPTSGPLGTNELELEIAYLEAQGLRGDHIERVIASDDPSALSGVKKLVGHTDGGKVILVSDPLNSMRLRSTASSDGLAPEISPGTPPDYGLWNDVGKVWNQALAVAVGRVIGFGQTGWATS
jgi:uncharacterized SAM-binding protein YcdF (DUF218 family)